MRLQVRSLASLSGLRIPFCCELWYRSQTQLGSGIAVTQVSSCSNWTPSLGTSICRGSGPRNSNNNNNTTTTTKKRQKTKKKKKKKKGKKKNKQKKKIKKKTLINKKKKKKKKKKKQQKKKKKTGHTKKLAHKK